MTERARKVIAACSTCGMGYLTLHQNDGPVCLCGRGRIWFLPEAEDDTPNTPAERERRRMLVVKTRLGRAPAVEPRDCHEVFV